MNYSSSGIAVLVFLFFVGAVLALSIYLGRRAKSSQGYFAAHGQIHWFVNGLAFAGDYLSAASFLGICGLIAFFGFDGFLYSIGFLAGWIVALFVIAEPLKRMGKYTLADALDRRFKSRGIRLAAAISTLIVSLFYLIPQMVGAGALVHPLLGLEYWQGVLIVGVIVILIVVSAGMVSTTWVQFIKGSLLIFFCSILTVMILNRGLTTQPATSSHVFKTLPAAQVMALPGEAVVMPTGDWIGKPYVRTRDSASGAVTTWRRVEKSDLLAECQTLSTKAGSPTLANGLPQSQHDIYPIGQITSLPNGQTSTGPLGPIAFLRTLQDSKILLWAKAAEPLRDAEGYATTVYEPKPTDGSKVLTPGRYFKGLVGESLVKKLDFVSLMLALFCGTASLPHILIRYYTVSDLTSARKSTVVGIGSIGFFYILTLFLGLGAMTSGAMDMTNNNMAAPLLARSFSPLLFAIISAVAFTTVLGTVSGLILAASGAVAHDIMKHLMGIELDDRGQVRAAKVAAIVVGVVAMALGVAFQPINVGVLVSWAFNIAASANLPALVMILFWSRTSRRGVAASIFIGLITSLVWVLVSPTAFKELYHHAPPPWQAPFDNPGIVTIPLSFIVLVLVSLLSRPSELPGEQPARAGAVG